MKDTTKYKDKMKFIYNAVNMGYVVSKNKDGSYTFSIDKSKDVPFDTFIKSCSEK